MSSEREQKLRAQALRKQIGQRARRAAPMSEPQTPRALAEEAAAKAKDEAEDTPEDDSDTCPDRNEKDRQDK